MENNSCSIGKLLKSSCHAGRRRKFFKIEIDIPIQEIELLRIRTKIEKFDVVDVCNHHMTLFI